MTSSIRAKAVSNLFGKASIVFILISFYFSYLVEGLTLNTEFRNVILFISFIFYFFKISVYPRLDISKNFFQYILLGLIIAAISVFFWFSLSEINVYFTLITITIVISSGLSFFKKSLKFFIYFILILALYEFFTKTYVFEVYRNTEWGIRALDPKFYGGNSGLFRAKALFEGPLALAQFAIGIALIFRDDLKILILSILLAILANGRLGMIICSFILIFHFIEKYNIGKFLKSKRGIWAMLLAIVGAVSFGSYFVSEKSIERFKTVLNFSDPSNLGRFYYWKEAINFYWDYNLLHKIFGNSGYFRDAIGNSAENGWLMLLLNNGFLGFLYYFTPFILIFLLSIKYKTAHFMFISVVFLSMMIQTFHLGASASLLYWIIMYIYLQELKIKTHA